MQRIDRLLANTGIRLSLFVLAAVLLRCATFGDLNRGADETFYFLVGQRMHEGALPYVDVWDRKPLGLFLIYYILAGISYSVLSYQIAACVVAGVAALIISWLVDGWSNQRGALTAGLTYILALGQFDGATGQSPDFYNPLIAGAALCLVRDTRRHAGGGLGSRSWAAMGLCGLALTIKQTTIFESVFLGCYLLCRLHRGGMTFAAMGRVAGLACALGAAPTVLIALVYFCGGHWTEFWHAMVLSNLEKARVSGGAWRAVSIFVTAAPLLLIAAWGLVLPTIGRSGRTFIATWTSAAVIGFLAVPNLYGHYFLPVLVPLSVATGVLFGYVLHWRILFLANALYASLWFDTINRAKALENNRGIREMSSLIRKYDKGGGLFIFDGPVSLYSVTGKSFLSPLVFPHHLNDQSENNVSHINTRREVDRVVSRAPGVVVMARFPTNNPVNAYPREKILAYVRKHCRKIEVEMIDNGFFNGGGYVIFGDCQSFGPDGK